MTLLQRIPWMTASLVAVVLWFTGTALTLSPEARTGPIVVAVPVALLLLALLRKDVRAWSPTSDPADHQAAPSQPVLWALALPALATAAGIVAGPVLFVVAWLRLRAGARLRNALAAGACSAVALWLLLMLGLGGRPGAAALPFWLS